MFPSFPSGQGRLETGRGGLGSDPRPRGRTRARQVERYRGRGIYANAQMGPREVKKFCGIGAEGEKLLELAVSKLGFSARAYDRALKVARTIADLAGEEHISPAHLSEAIQYRAMDRYY
jgi:magnesium chelatase family protein